MIVLFSILLVIVLLGGGGWGVQRYGWLGGTPVALVLIVLGLLYLTGHLSLR